MSISHSNQKLYIVLALLMAVGYAGNYFLSTLIFGRYFLCGSIAILLVVRLYGTKWGTLAAIIANTQTVFLGNYPYIAIALICEALCVGLLSRRTRQNLVLLDGIYWLCIGMPLMWLFHFAILHLDATQTGLLILKQSINGIYNALIADLIVTYLPIHKWLGRPQVNNTHSLQQTLLNLLLAFVIFPSLTFMALDNHRAMTEIENKIQAEIKFVATDLSADLRSWHQRYQHALSELAQLAAHGMTPISSKGGRQDVYRYVPTDTLQQSTELIHQTFPDFHNLYIINAAARVIASYPKTNAPVESKIGLDIDSNFILQQTQTTLHPAISDIHIDKVLPIPHIDLTVPLVTSDSFQGWAFGSLDLSYVSNLLKSHNFYQGWSITLVNSHRRIIASTKSELLPMQRLEGRDGERRFNRSSMFIGLPAQGKLPPIARWLNSFHVQEIPIGDNISWTMVVEVPAATYISYLYNLLVKYLTIMLFVAILALIFGVLLSRSLARPLSKLAWVTTNLPHKLLERETINWPNSGVREIDSLVCNFKFMAIALEEKFREIQSANETLEQRVQERTAAVLQANNNLESEITERHRTQEALLERTRLAALKADVGITLNQSNTLQEILQKCVQILVQHLDAAFARIWTLDIEENVLELQASAGIYTHINGSHSRIPVGQFKIGLIAQNRQPHLTNQVIGDPRVHDQEWAAREGMVAFAGYPLIIEDRLVGVMAMFARHPFAEATLQSMASVANGIALGIQRKRTEEALRESEEKFRQMAENIHEVFWMCNADRSELIYVSPAYEQIWGRTCESLYANSKSWLDAIHPEDRECASLLHTYYGADAALEKHSQGEYDIEYRLLRPDGSIRWIWDRGFGIRNQAGEIYRVAGIANDITERKQAEEEIRYALEKEKQLNDLKSRFITTASHEFRTPLTTIILCAEFLEHYNHKTTEEKKRQYYTRIQTAVNRMTQLLNDVLLTEKAQAGKLEFNPVPMELEKFCINLVEEMQLSAGSKHIINFESLGQCHEACLDEKLLWYILSNLLSNGIKFSPQGGQIKFDLICQPGEAIFQIQDQGIGIPPDDQPQVFNSFHRGSNVSTIPGTGLGLSIVKQCVNLQGGQITVSSELGVGTTFTVTLPTQ